MEKKIIILLQFIILSCFMAFGDGYKGPSHPLNYYNHRIVADTVYHYKDAENVSLGRTIITRSADGLTDTILIESGLIGYFVYRYNEKGQLIYNHEYFPGHPEIEYSKHCYVYDDEGLLIEEPIYRVSQLKTPSEVLDTIYIWDNKKNITMTEKGYIYDFGDVRKEYELDSLNRATRISYPDNKDEYLEYEGKQYRVGDSYYTYTDSSVIRFARERVGINILEMQDMWVYSEDIFDKYGNNTSGITKTSVDGIAWSNYGSGSRSVYVFSSGNPYSNEPLPATTTQVYAVPGAIKIHTEKASKVGIYTFGGRLEKSLNIPPGDSTIGGLPPGIYIVNVGNDSFKVIMR